MSQRLREECKLSVQIAAANVGAARTKAAKMRKPPAHLLSLLGQAQSALLGAIAELSPDAGAS